MKKIILFFIFSLCLNTFITPQAWRQGMNTPISSIYGSCFVDQNTAWVVGAYQSMYKSTDGGMTWVNKFSMNNASYSAYNICFVNSTTGFVGCNYGKILKTTDGGETWQKILIPDTTYTNWRIHFFDANLGFSLSTKGSASIIYKTTDGGASWASTAAIAAAMNSFDFSSPTVGIATGNASNLYYTTDGTTWNKGTPPANWPQSYSKTDQATVKFISSSTAISCGWGSTAAGLEPTIFLKTTNAGASWTYLDQALQNRVYVNFRSLYFKDSLNGIAAGGATYPGTVLCRTSDGGINWIPLPTVAGFTSPEVLGYDNRIILSGGGGAILLSTDFGDSWVVINKNTRETLYSIKNINNNIYACGQEGTFYKSTDMGNSFNMNYMVTANKCITTNAIQFITENLGYAACQRGQALKTTNGGESWTQILPDTSSSQINNLALCFINGNIGFIAGIVGSSIDVIYKTTDGGQSWSNVQNLAHQNLNSIAFADDLHGAAGGNKSAMLFTTDQGVSWNTSTVNSTDQLNINSIKFYDGLNGIAVGASIILNTSDGGATWNKITSVPQNTLTSVCHFESTFYAVGEKYCFKSIDVGQTWQNIMDSAIVAQKGFVTMNAVEVDKNGNLWVGGNGGMLTNAPVTGINNDAFNPKLFTLNQNYPNPFNPTTVISFSLPERSWISLKVYDILGRVVEVLMDGVMNSGIHKINFDGKKLASGIYLYSLSTNKVRMISKKMVLIK
jgi:photosystem II stability/assembly factor-like uncharacterized protein